MTLGELTRRIEEQTYYLFVSYDDIDKNIGVSVGGGTQSVRQVLDTSLAPTPYTYSFSKNYISLARRPVPEPEPPAEPQPQNYEGTVTDPEGKPVVGVAVIVKATGMGAFSDVDGRFAVAAIPGQRLQFRLLGYETVERNVPAGGRTIAVTMKPAVNEIDEVVAVGMGYQRKVSVTGAITNVKMTDLNTPARSVSNALAGRLAGIVAVQRSGEPGADDSDFWIRGISTFGANRTPLILIDGVERAYALSNIDIEEIESVSILKDASATAVYGSRAANGVVIITTKRGETGPPRVELKMETGVSRLTRVPKMLNGLDYMTLYNEAAKREIFSPAEIEATRNQTDPYLYPDVDWLGEIFKKNGTRRNVAINVRGGSPVGRYFAAFGYLNESGNLRGDDTRDSYTTNINLEKYNYRFNADLQLTPTTVLSAEVGGHVVSTHMPAVETATLFSNAYAFAPVEIPVRYPMGEDLHGNTNWVWAGDRDGRNPVKSLLGSGYSKQLFWLVTGQAHLTQSLDGLVKGLSANAAFAIDTYSESRIWREEHEPSYIATGRDEAGELMLAKQSGGDDVLDYRQEMDVNRAMELKAKINYERVFGERHRVGAMAIYFHRGFCDGNASNAEKALPYRKQGMAFRATYSYGDRYFAEFNAGYNGSEKFAPGYRFGFFPAGSIGYMISGERFWREGPLADIVPTLKLRASLGIVGSEDVPNGRRLPYQTMVGETTGYYFGPDGTYHSGIHETQSGVDNLTWERGLKSNVGIDIDLSGGLSLQFDIFSEHRSGVLIRRETIPGMVGITDQPYANIGTMRNRGMDASVEMNDNIGTFHYRVYANATFNKNKILYMDEPARLWDYQRKTGQQLDQTFGLVAIGYFTDQEDVKNSPRQRFSSRYGPGDIKYRDVNDDGVVDYDDMVPIGYSNIPQLTYGFGVQVMWRGIDAKMLFRGMGRVSYMLEGDGFVPFMDGVLKGNALEKTLDRWTEENPRQDAFYPRLIRGVTTTDNNYIPSTKWLYSGAFLRLSDVEVGYTFPWEWLSRAGIRSARVYFHGSNLALFSPFRLWDPEVGRGNGNAYPLTRKFNLGLQLNF